MIRADFLKQTINERLAARFPNCLTVFAVMPLKPGEREREKATRTEAQLCIERVVRYISLTQMRLIMGMTLHCTFEQEVVVPAHVSTLHNARHHDSL